MSFCLLSCTENLDHSLAERLALEIKNRGSRVAYLSSSPQEEPYTWYQSTIADYKAIDASIHVDYFDLSERFTDEDLSRLRAYRVIYLSGGNTFTFLDAARKRNVYPILKACADADGLLIGASAGSLMLSPSIELAGDEDENSVGMTDFTGFNFVDFAFYPHWIGDEAQTSFLRAHAQRAPATTYTCPDGSGIFYSSSGVRLFGKVAEFPRA